jgi:energy-coupling factor transport system ATP-binding protein
VKDKLADDLGEAAAVMGLKGEAARDEIRAACERLGIAHLSGRHPYDLSGGEQQKAAFAKMLLLRPRVLLLDEPTKGLDARAKTVLAGILRQLKEEGRAIVIATHDVEFAALHADRCAMFFDGRIVSEDAPAAFFAGNTFYTTAAYRMSRGFYRDAVTVEAVAMLCGRNPKRVGAGTRSE